MVATTSGHDQRQSAAPEEPPLPAVLLELVIGGCITQAIGVAARMGVADALAGGARSSAELAAIVDAHAPTLHRLLRALADVGIVEELDQGRFALTPMGELLRSDVPGSMRGWATMVGLPFYRDAWTDLYESVRTGQPAFERVHGEDLFAYLGTHPDDAAVFAAAMEVISGRFLAGIVDSYGFGQFHTVIDVGGGTGALLAAILHANPAARGVLLDRPEVLAGASAVLEPAGVADRCQLVAGDFFAAVPDSGDLYVLSNVIHDWDDELAVRILSRCRNAMSDHARLLIVELVLPDGPESSLGKLADLEMLALTPGGRHRTVAQYSALLAAVGLHCTAAVTATAGHPASYIEAAPA